MALTPKQDAFVREYLIDLNATQAAIRAGYSERTAVKIGSENIRKPDVQNAIQQRRVLRTQRVEWSAEEILRDLKEIAEERANPLKERIKAYELGGRHAAMFTDKLAHSGNVGVTIQNDIPRKSD